MSVPPPDGLHAFYEDLSQDIFCRAELEEDGGFRENAFTGICIDLLTEAGEFEDGQVCHYESLELKVSGYSLSEEDESRLTLLASIYRNEPEPFAVSLTDARAMLVRARKFCMRSMHGLHLKLEEAYESYDLAHSIYRRRTLLREVRLLLTNGTVRSTARLKPWTVDGVVFVPEVMDLERMHRLSTYGDAHEKIEFTLEELDSQPLQAVCVRVPPRKTPDSSEAPACGGYATYLTVMP